MSLMSILLASAELCFYQVLQYRIYLLGVSVLYLLYRYMRSRISSTLPPGPWGLPVVGYWLFLNKREPHLHLERLRKKYGDVFGMYLGSKYALFIGDLKKSKDAYNMEVFSGRPEGAFPISEKNTHFAALSGQPWKERRKAAAQALRQIGVGSRMIQRVSQAQINLAIQRLEDEIRISANSELNVREILTHASITVVLNFVCGKAFPPEHPSYQIVDKFLRFFAEKGTSISVDMVMPWTKPIMSILMPHGRKARKTFEDMEQFIRKEVESHIRNRSEVSKDLIDFYLSHYEAQGPEIPINDVSGDAQIMIFGGGDTVRETTEWFLLCMAQYPEIQEKVFREIDSILGPSNEVWYEDKDKLPYTEAAILECFRFRLIAPLNPYHSSLQETQFCGFTIPKDSLVFCMLWTLHNNPAHWARPDQFYPEHFLSRDLKKIEIPDAFQPFAPGKRVCIGDKVAQIETYIFCVSLVREFHILPPSAGVNLDGNLRINMEARHPVVKLVKRSTV